MDTSIAALEAALNNRDRPTRRTFGNVEYALIPVTVVEAVIADADNFADYDGEDLDEIDYDDDDINAGDEVEITAAEVAVVVTPTDPLAGLPEDTTVEVAGPSPASLPDNEANGEVADATFEDGDFTQGEE